VVIAYSAMDVLVAGLSLVIRSEIDPGTPRPAPATTAAA
jgi:hypothetical protein